VRDIIPDGFATSVRKYIITDEIGPEGASCITVSCDRESPVADGLLSGHGPGPFIQR
jgi:hypothetical protein